MNTTIALQAHSLHSIVKHSVRALIRRYHLNRDWIIGLIGTRGSGKSLGAANIAVRDFMMDGDKCWSNMQICHTVKVPDQVAKHYGLDEGGEIEYKSEYIKKKDFLALDERYRDGILVFDEFNIEYGEARRSIANINLMTDRAIQQLRKLRCGLIYTVLDEMYVDPRIRENTDVFIKCVDTALNPGALREHKTQGKDFEWLIFPITARYIGNGRTFAETKQKVGPIPMEMGSLWNIIDTYERQGVGATKYGETLMPVQVQEDEDTKKTKDVIKRVTIWKNIIYNNHLDEGDYVYLDSRQISKEIGVDVRGWGKIAADFNQADYDFLDKISEDGESPARYRIRNHEKQSVLSTSSS